MQAAGVTAVAHAEDLQCCFDHDPLLASVSIRCAGSALDEIQRCLLRVRSTRPCRGSRRGQGMQKEQGEGEMCLLIAS